jgi:hypothetical protein
LLDPHRTGLNQGVGERLPATAYSEIDVAEPVEYDETGYVIEREREPVIETPIVSQEDIVDVESLSHSDVERVTDEHEQQNVRHEDTARHEETERHEKTKPRQPLLPAEPEQILNAQTGSRYPACDRREAKRLGLANVESPTMWSSRLIGKSAVQCFCFLPACQLV